jgi:alkylhydroperoxidase family enzyme
MAWIKVINEGETGAMRRADVSKLRDAGFRGSEILDIAQVTAYFNFVNRMASGLGVDLEPRFTP